MDLKLHVRYELKKEKLRSYACGGLDEAWISKKIIYETKL
jgi:hypothetical protein